MLEILNLTVGAEGIVGDLEGVDLTTDEGVQAIRDFMEINANALGALA